MKKLILCIVIMLILPSCAAAHTSFGFNIPDELETQITASYMGTDYEVMLKLSKDGSVSITFLKPDELNSMIISVNSDGCTTESAGMVLNYTKAELGASCPFVELYDVFVLLRNREPDKTIHDKNTCTYEYDFPDGKYRLTVDTQSNKLKTIEYGEYQFNLSSHAELS